FKAENTNFWRRASFSSPFLDEKHSILTTRTKLVTVLGWETPIFGDETCSRHHFEAKNALF
ncbi:hypothetical protein LIZ76_18020, partial [Caldibacillus sp. 210928-DFI.2.22]|nr:hypothetical protein [Caldibacillus sp. 210928-DFI.2.22]